MAPGLGDWSPERPNHHLKLGLFLPALPHFAKERRGAALELKMDPACLWKPPYKILLVRGLKSVQVGYHIHILGGWHTQLKETEAPPSGTVPLCISSSSYEDIQERPSWMLVLCFHRASDVNDGGQSPAAGKRQRRSLLCLAFGESVAPLTPTTWFWTPIFPELWENKFQLF